MFLHQSLIRPDVGLCQSLGNQVHQIPLVVSGNFDIQTSNSNLISNWKAIDLMPFSRSPVFFWTMLRASLQQWQSLIYASSVIVRPLVRMKGQEPKKPNQAKTAKRPNKQNTTEQTRREPSWPIIKRWDRWNKLKLSRQTTFPGSHNVFSRT